MRAIRTGYITTRESGSSFGIQAKRLLIFVCLGALSGCSLGYYLQSARGQAALMSRRVPLQEVIDDPATPPALRARLARVSAARAFATDSLGLPGRKGYRSYADLDRPYAVWSVTATKEFSLEPETWCFPIAGCVSYRGYFRQDDAKRFAQRLRDKGFDVALRGVAAYSTLGYFDDPVLSSMLKWDDSQLVAIIFHELAHQLLYVKNDTPFNESFATVVEEAGIVRWAAQLGLPGELESYRERSESQARFLELVGAAREALSIVYASGLPVATMRARKAAVLADLVAAYQALRDAGEISNGYDAWFTQDLNNAELAAVGVYQQWVPALRVLLAKSGDEPGQFYAQARRLGELPSDERRAVLEKLSGE